MANENKTPSTKASSGKRRKLGDILISAGVINQQQINEALKRQTEHGGRLGRVLVDMGYLSEEVLVRALSKQLSLPVINLRKTQISDEILRLIPVSSLMKHLVVPIAREGNNIKVAMANPLDHTAIKEIEFIIGGAVLPVVAPPSQIEHFLKQKYTKGTETIDNSIPQIPSSQIRILKGNEAGDRIKSKTLSRTAGVRNQIGEILLKAGAINKNQFEDALRKQVLDDQPLEMALINTGAITESDIAKILAEELNVEQVNLKEINIQESFINHFDINFLIRHGILPLGREGNTLKVVMANPLDFTIINHIEFIAGGEVQPAIGISSHIREYLLARKKSTEDKFHEKKETDSSIRVLHDPLRKTDKNDILRAKNEAKSIAISSIINDIILEAVNDKAETVHIEPRTKDVLVRGRIDGLLKNMSIYSIDAHLAVSCRLRIMSGIDMDTINTPQTGTLRLKIGGKFVEVYLSFMSTINGEKIVLKVRKEQKRLRNPEDLGMLPKSLYQYYSLLSRPQGMIVFSGPARSGKTTTMYASLRFLLSNDINVVTVEDPIEQVIPGVFQMQINEKMAYADGLQTLFRQDPDVIMIGEIHDRETANIAFRASLNGRLVLSTFNTQNGVSTINRLMDTDMDSSLAASAVSGVVAQRLIRRNCPHCLRKYTPAPYVLTALRIESADTSKMSVYQGQGCDLCNNKGYLGQSGIFEIIRNDETIRKHITQKGSEKEILMAARGSGTTTMEENALYLVLNKTTTFEEILRVVPPEEISVKSKDTWEKNILGLFDEPLPI